MVSTALPERAAATVPRTGGAYTRATAGTRLFLAVPGLRALLALNLAVAAAGAMVTVNSVVYVRDVLGLSVGAVPLALGAYGAGSMAVALVLPRLLDKVQDRAVMLPGALSLTVTAAPGGGWWLPALLVLWAAFGAASSAVLTPAGRLVRRSVAPGERTAAFAAQFSLSHGCWLLTYPPAEWLGAAAGLNWAVLALGSIAVGAALVAVRLWPARSTADAHAAPVPTSHVHADLPLGHPRLAGALRVPTGWLHNHGHLTDGLHTR